MINNSPRHNFFQGVPDWLRRVGLQSWFFLGVVLAFTIFLALFVLLNDIFIPLVISLLLAILSRPLVDWLERHKVSRPLATVLTMALILVGLIALVVIVVKGIWQQAPEINQQLQVGWISLQAWFSQFDIQLPSASKAGAALADALPAFFDGLFGFLGSTLSTVIGLFVGLYFSAFILFFFLRDTDEIETWIGHRISPNPRVGTTIVRDSGQTVLIYFRGTALTALITSVVVAIPLLILKVPLVGSILILYFFTSFIPYLGAWIAGAFAVLIALGAGGVETALIILTAVIISNGMLQSVVSSWALGSMLKIHPLVIFLVTIIAGIVGGVLLMILAVPLTAIVIQVGNQLRQEDSFSDEIPDTTKVPEEE